MGVFKKLKGNDVRVTPIRVMFGGGEGEGFPGTNYNIDASSSRGNFANGTKGVENAALVYNSIRQLFYGAFISQDFTGTGSIFSAPLEGTPSQEPQGTFSRFDPSFQGSLAYQRKLPLGNGAAIGVYSIPTKNFGESMVPGTVNVDGLVDDKNGNLYDGGSLKGNVFYDQGIIVRTDGASISSVSFSGSYTIYSSQYKCTVNPDEFNLSMNPSLRSTATLYNTTITDFPEFMPFVTTIGLYNDDQDLIAVAKLSNPVQLNPYVDTNFIVRIDL